jgi:hypothetical protein
VQVFEMRFSTFHTTHRHTYCKFSPYLEISCFWYFFCKLRDLQRSILDWYVQATARASNGTQSAIFTKRKRKTHHGKILSDVWEGLNAKCLLSVFCFQAMPFAVSGSTRDGSALNVFLNFKV